MPTHKTSSCAHALANELIKLLPMQRPGLFNPYRDRCVEDTEQNGPTAKIARLAAHLDCEATHILVGEAPGYQGCRHSGLGFTSERLLLEGKIPRIDAPKERLTTRRLPYSEPSATTMWRVLEEAGIHRTTILWNALQLHPFEVQPSKAGKLPHQTNRAPTAEEVVLGIPSLRKLVMSYPNARIVAVGNVARDLLARSHIPAAKTVRHPSYGGVGEFEAGIKAIC